MLDIDDFKANFQTVLKKRIVVFGEPHTDAYRRKINELIVAIMQARKSKVLFLVEELRSGVVVKDNYDFYIEKINHGDTRYGWFSAGLMFAKEHQLEIRGIEAPHNHPEYMRARKADVRASQEQKIQIYRETFKVRELHMLKGIHQAKGPAVVICGDTHLRSIKTSELGEPSYIVNDSLIKSEGIVFRADENSREIN